MDQQASSGEWGVCDKHKLPFIAFDEQLWE